MRKKTMQAQQPTNLLTWITLFGYALLCGMLWIAR
jgi:hypothetical protein